MVQIFTGAAAGVRGTLVMPDQDEKAKLTAIVYRHYPNLDPSQDGKMLVQLADDNPKAKPKYVEVGGDAEYDPNGHLALTHRKMFHYAFYSVGQLGRLPEPELHNPKSASWWCGYCNEFMRDCKISDCDIRVDHLVTAILSHGDIPHCFPKELRFGLTIGNTGIPATDKWRNVIAGTVPQGNSGRRGNLVPPTPVNWPEYAPVGRQLDPFGRNAPGGTVYPMGR